MSDLVMAGPCCICGATNYGLSYGGPSICSACDCGDFGQARIARQGKELLAAIARAEAAEKLVGGLLDMLKPIADKWQRSIDRYTRCGSKQHETMPETWPVEVEISVKAARLVHSLTRARQREESDALPAPPEPDHDKPPHPPSRRPVDRGGGHGCLCAAARGICGGDGVMAGKLEARKASTLEEVRRCPGLFTGQLDEDAVIALEREGYVVRRWEGASGSLGLSKVYPV